MLNNVQTYKSSTGRIGVEHNGFIVFMYQGNIKRVPTSHEHWHECDEHVDLCDELTDYLASQQPSSSDVYRPTQRGQKKYWELYRQVDGLDVGETCQCQGYCVKRLDDDIDAPFVVWKAGASTGTYAYDQYEATSFLHGTKKLVRTHGGWLKRDR